MLSFHDKTFCSADCMNTDCERNKNDIPEDVDLPVCYADFSQDCPEYEPEEME